MGRLLHWVPLISSRFRGRGAIHIARYCVFFFYNQLVHQIGKRVEVARGLEFLDQHNAKKLREDFDGHRDDVVCTVIADIEKEVSVRGTDARLAVSGLSTPGVQGDGTENRLFSRGTVMRWRTVLACALDKASMTTKFNSLTWTITLWGYVPPRCPGRLGVATREPAE